MNLLIAITMFAQFTSPCETRVFVNLESNLIIFAKVFQGQVVTIDSIKSLSNYFETSLKIRNQKLLLEELKREIVKQGGYANKGLIGTFEIPLPKGSFSEFMGETGKLDVGGYVKITIGGSQTFLTNYPGTQASSFFPELEMKQEMAINLDGEVGDRMRVYIDHNSERVDETQNKITVTYKGKEDEIIQEIEGGDTQLSIPGTTYTGDIPSHRGLFGIKSTAKAGPLDIVAIASNEQTQTQELVIEGGIKADSDRIYARYYATRQFFDLGLAPGEEIVELKVYVDDYNGQNNNNGMTYYGRVYLDINDDSIPHDTTEYEQGYFTRIWEGQDYLLYGDIVELTSGLENEQDAMGVWYKKRRDGVVYTVGTQPSSLNDTILLKLICPRKMDATSFTWKYYEHKNYYQIIAPGSRLDSLRVYYQPSGKMPIDRNSQGVTFNKLLGIDNNNDELPDENTAWLSDRGILRFPDPLPFVSPSLPEPDSEIYSNPYYMTGISKYFLYKKTIEAKPMYDLPENVIGVKVYVDDVEQDSIKDYHVDYGDRKLEFKKPIPPTARVRIVAEYAPFISLSQKSLIGVRASVKTLGQGTWGSSFFYRTEGYPSIEHVGLKEEPFNRMVLESDFALPVNLPGLTKAVDWLPLIETETESKFNLNFEGAYSFSDLNSEGKVYLDDLESSTISDDAAIMRISWVPCSAPVGLNDSNFVRQRLIWYNPQDDDRLQAYQIYVNPIDRNEIADVLKIIYKPDSLPSFGGLTQYIYGKNLDETENLEVIIKGKGGKMHIDLCTWVNEDQLRRNRTGSLVGQKSLQDEDRLSPRNSIDFKLEDTGLDTVFGDDDASVAGDDGNDDYQINDYTGGINGTEGNQIWDTEDIDRNGSLNDKNWYYSYSFDLDDTLFLVGNAGLRQGWKMFRVPIKDSLKWDTMIGQPDWHSIKLVRIWFDSCANAETLLLYKLSLTGSRWKNRGINTGVTNPDPTEVFTVTPVNTKTHAYYLPPYQEFDPLTNQIKPEGGLEFRLENIKQNHTCVAYRRTEEYEDYRAYDTLTFLLKVFKRNPRISLKLGTDSTHYYEYTIEYDSGALGYALNSYRTFKVDLSHFTQLKKQRPRGDDSSLVSDGTYSVLGNPSLAQNQFFEVRIQNQDIEPLSDTMWFNDIKLVSPRNEVGQTLRTNGAINFADFTSFTFAYDRSNGRFKRLSDTKDMSTQGAGENYAVGADFSLSKLLPQSWNFNIPLSLSYRKSLLEPRFAVYANDIELIGPERGREESQSISRSYMISISKANSKNWLLKQTLDRLTYSHDRSQSISHSPNYIDTSEAINHRAAYSLDPKLSFKVLGQVFSVLPQQISMSALYSDNFPKSYYRENIDTAYQPLGTMQRRRSLNPSFSTSYSPHSIINSSFNFSQNRDSVSERRRFGEEVGRNQSFNASVSKNLKVISPLFTFNNTYNEDYRFEIRDTFDYRNVSNSARYGVSGSVDLKMIIKLFTRLRDESNDSLLVPGSPLWIVKQVEQFADYLQNPSMSFTRQRTSSYLQVMGRPSMQYQLGLVDSIPSTDIAPNSYPGRGMSDNYGVNSGVNYRIIGISGGFTGQITRTFLPTGSENRTTSNSYPNATVRISRVEALPLLKKYMQSSSVSSGFNQTLEYRYTIDDSTTLDSDSKTRSFSPLLSWQANWHKGISSTTEVSYSETNSRQYDAGNTNQSRSVNRGGSVTVGYTFSAPRGINLPLLKGLKFNSNLTTSVSVSYNRSTSYAIDLERPTNNTSVLRTNVGLTYNFSSSVTGGANFDYAENKETNSDQDSKRVGLNLWTNINF